MTAEETAPYIIIDEVQISVDHLPEEAKGIFGRVQRLNQKKANLTLDLEEIQASLNFFSNKIVDIVNSEVNPKKNKEEEANEEKVKSNK